MIPKQLRDKKLGFVLLKPKNKIPFENRWQQNPYRYNDKKLRDHIDRGGNFGVIGGYGNLRVRDIDDKDFASALIKNDNFDTFVVKTGSGGLHLYYLSDYDKNEVLSNGEMRCKNYQVVAPTCIHPNGNKYEVISDKPIKELPAKDLEQIWVEPYRKKEDKSSKDDLKGVDDSRSGLEYRKILALLRKGKSREEIYKTMGAYSKWKESPEQYRNLTFEKAEDFYLKSADKEVLASKTAPKILSFKELLNYEAPLYSWRVSKLIQDKKIVIVAGSSAVYKSWLSLNMALCIAMGKPFLDNFETEQGRVLYVDRENSIPELQNRVEMLAKGLGLEAQELPLDFLSEQSVRLDLLEDRDFLENYIKEKKICLVVVDTYRRVIGFEENSADSVSLFFTEGLKPICERTGCSFVFIHHHKKGREGGDTKELLRGSSDLVNFVDGVLQVERVGNKIIINQTKNRSGKELDPFELLIETDEDEFLRFKYLGLREDTTTKDRGVQVLLLWIAKQGVKQFKTAEAQQVCKEAGIKKVNFYASLKELTKRGVIQKISKGAYKVQDLGDSSSSTPKRVEQLNKLSPSKSNSSFSSFEQVELVEQPKSKPRILGEVQL